MNKASIQENIHLCKKKFIATESSRKRIASEGADIVEEVRADQIGSVLPGFNPGKEFKRVLEAIKFNKN